MTRRVSGRTLKAQDNNLDAAVAELCCDRAGDARTVLPDLPFIESKERGKPLVDPLPATQLELNDRVAKLGRSSGYTRGRVRAVALDNVSVICRNPRPSRFVFSQVIEIAWEDGTKFGTGGDSGALIYRIDDMRPVGLYFASFEEEGEEPVSYAIQLDRVRDEYNLTFV